MKRGFITKQITCILVLMISFSTLAIFAGGSAETNKGATSDTQNINPDVLVEAPFEGWVEGLPKILAPEGFNWRKYEGVTLNFISENTTPSTALAANINSFTDKTGIKVNIEQADLSVVVEKVGLDINSKLAKYALIYADPYQILAKNYNSFVDLNTFENDPYRPSIPGGLDDFISSHLEVCGYMGNKDKLFAIPYDSPTILWAYRKDIIEKYKGQFMAEKGYDWTPSEDSTWDQYYEISKWINDKVASGLITEVKYGTGHQAAQYDSLMCDFSNVLSSYGGDWFAGTELGNVGAISPGKSTANSKEAIQAAEFYNKLLAIAAPGSSSWDWNGLSEAFAASEIAMAPEWHEFSAVWENPASSKVVGNVGWEVLPKGPDGRGNIYGGTGVAISKYATQEEQDAAWLFLVWATSPQAQYDILKSKVGGSTPTRYSV
jgi:multiple sugar transport system substrate-binding protein